MAEGDEAAGGEKIEAEGEDREDRRLGDEVLGEIARQLAAREGCDEETGADDAAKEDA